MITSYNKILVAKSFVKNYNAEAVVSTGSTTVIFVKTDFRDFCAAKLPSLKPEKRYLKY